jgi:hypothetical protein
MPKLPSFNTLPHDAFSMPNTLSLNPTNLIAPNPFVNPSTKISPVLTSTFSRVFFVERMTKRRWNAQQ